MFHLAAYLFDQHIAVQPVIFGIQGSFWCEAMQNPREEAVWRDFVWTLDITKHYTDVSRLEDVTLFCSHSFCHSRNNLMVKFVLRRC